MVADPRAYQKEANRTQGADIWRALALTVCLLGPFVGGWIATGSAWAGIGAGVVTGAACYGVIRAPRDLGSIQPPPVPAAPPAIVPPVVA